jgi:hypothetical protein
MTQRVDATPLAGRATDQALPLVQITWPGIDATAWRCYLRFIAARADRDAGGLMLRDRADYLNGMAVYEAEHDLHHGRVLTIHLFTAFDIANSVVPVRALLNAVIDTARSLDCASIQIRIYDEQPGLRTRLRRLGLAERAGYLWRKVAA